MAKPAPQSVAQYLPPFSHTGQCATAGRLSRSFVHSFGSQLGRFIEVSSRVSSGGGGETGRRECSNAALQLVIYLPRAAKTMCMAKGLILRHGNGMRARPVLRQHICWSSSSSSRSWPNTMRLDSDSALLANFEAAPP